MNFTVKMRIIIGFVTISILLLVISISSLGNLRSLQTDVEQVNNLAIPTVGGSNALKASFLNMGRLTFEGFISESLDIIQDKEAQFNNAKNNFDNRYQSLSNIVAAEPKLSASLRQTESLYGEYLGNVDDVFSNLKLYVSLRNTIENKLGDVEDSADDASSLILDFSDLDEVSSNDDLALAAERAGRLETLLMSLMTASSDYIKTENLVRADTIGNEVKLIVAQVSEQLNTVLEAAKGQDDSGTLEDISSLVGDSLNTISGTDGILALHEQRLRHRNQAETALSASEQKALAAMDELEILLSLADAKAKEIETDVNNSVANATLQIIVIVLISLVVAAFIGYRTVSAITRPLAKVNELLHIASSGDLTHRLDDTSEDEFGLLARNCNKLISNLKELIAGINTRAEQLAAASEQTSSITLQATKSIQDQKSQIALVATATTEMHATSQLVTQGAEDTLKQIKHADDESENVRNISNENKNTIEVLARDVEEAAVVINKLHQDSASIGGILDVIRGIAEQTNLLALNAAIEAARAGEYGRGFAVVADEVRTLASRTQESTQEINSMIEMLQAGAEKAVAVMNQGKEQTAVCVAQTDIATKALDLISEAVRHAHDVSSQIEQSAREQNLVSQDISEKLETIVNIAEETSIGSQQTSESSHEVAKLAEELQQSIRQFKV
jgi:methyl-accepting chemotaxis protein